MESGKANGDSELKVQNHDTKRFADKRLKTLREQAKKDSDKGQ